MEKKDFQSFCDKCYNKEGLVLIGCDEDLFEWSNGVLGILTEENIASGLDFDHPFHLETTGGRIDIVMPFKKENRIDIGKLAMWRLKFGDCSWISDYIKNYKDQH